MSRAPRLSGGAPRPRRHVLIDGATLALVISKKLCFSAMQNVDDGRSRPIATLQNFGR
jgi:hypothetical protein